MSERRAEQKTKILSQLADLVRSRIEDVELQPILDFIACYYRVSPVEELAERSLDNLYGATLSCWEHLQEPVDDAPRIHVFNPDLERHGWHCGHTVIQILQQDMPFLVDSVRMELNRRGLSIHVVHSGVIHVQRTGQATRVVATAEGQAEALIYIEVDRHSNVEELKTFSQSYDDPPRC